MELSELQKDLLGYSSHDDMGLWIISQSISDSGSPDEPYDRIRNESIKVIRIMLQNGWLVIGRPVDSDGEVIFQLISMSVAEAITFIENEWDKLGRLPNLGEVCWFRATPAGMQLANDLGLID